MEKEFIPYELAFKLTQLDFDELCLASYTKAGLFIHPFDIKSDLEEDNVILDSLYLKNSEMHFDYVAAPLYQQVFRWFREKYQIECHIKSLYEQRENKGFYFGLDDYKSRDFYSNTYFSYKEAELECLKKLIEIVKNK